MCLQLEHPFPCQGQVSTVVFVFWHSNVLCLLFRRQNGVGVRFDHDEDEAGRGGVFLEDNRTAGNWALDTRLLVWT